MTELNKELFKSMVYGYAMITKDNAKEEHKDRVWYKHSNDVTKHFRKRRPRALSKGDYSYVVSKREELLELDMTYFEGKDFSSYVCMITILQYLVEELRDTEMRVKFGHYDFKQIDKELHEMLKDINFDAQKYLSRLIEAVI